MVNRGVAPYDASSLTGQFRVFYGDTQYVPLNPAETGYGDYTELSDDEIEAFLNSANNSVYRAIGNYYAVLAGNAAKLAQTIKDYDLSVDNSKRPAALLEMAKYWWGLADNEDEQAGGSDIFEVFAVTPKTRCCVPEGAPTPVYCRCNSVLF